MKNLSVLPILLFLLCFYYNAEAQYRLPKLVVITFNQDSASLAIPSEVVLFTGDTLQFVSKKGDFDILITNAYKFLKIVDDDLKFRIDNSTSPASAKYVVRKIKEYDTKYSIYCISNNSWPEAPPRIIIVSQ